MVCTRCGRALAKVYSTCDKYAVEVQLHYRKPLGIVQYVRTFTGLYALLRSFTEI